MLPSAVQSNRFVQLLFGCFLLCFGVKGYAQKNITKPNIIYILADDLGYGDVSVNNPDGKIETPYIDLLAKQGMRFTDAHTTSSVCTPSRYSLLTGRYPWRSRLAVGVLRGYSRTLIEPQTPTVASMLQAEGYQTAVVGKWHLGLDWTMKAEHADSLLPKYNANNMFGIKNELLPEQIDFKKPATAGPLTQGFNYSYILPASLDMPPYCFVQNDSLTELPTAYTNGNKLDTDYTGPFWRAGLKAPSFEFYQTLPTFTQKATDFISRQTKKQPFFLYFPMPAPHTPWLPTPAYKSKSVVGDYGDYVKMVDDAVGEILKTVENMGFSKNTIIVFSSDNGPYWRDNFVKQYNHASAGVFRGMKGDAFEGGHRVPFIVKYPNHVKPGSVSNVTTTLANLMATCADIVGNHSEKYIPEDSYSILPILLGKSTTIDRQPAIVNISSIGFYSIRKGPWKLITKMGSGGFTAPKEITPKGDEPIGQLYNLETDIHEDVNLYKQNPEKVKELTELLEKIKKFKK